MTALQPPFDPWEEIKQKAIQMFRDMTFVELIICMGFALMFFIITVGVICGN